MSKSPSTLLLVEGRDDEHVVKSICGRMQIGHIDEIRSEHNLPSTDKKPPSGKEALLKTLTNYLETRGEELTALGVLLDADDDRDAPAGGSSPTRFTRSDTLTCLRNPIPQEPSFSPPTERFSRHSRTPALHFLALPTHCRCLALASGSCQTTSLTARWRIS